MEYLAEIWVRTGAFFGRRPVQILGLALGGVILIGVLGYSATTANNNQNDINDVKKAFCVPPIGARLSRHEKLDQVHKCQALLGRLLEHPTPAQARRLKQIVKETP